MRKREKNAEKSGRMHFRFNAADLFIVAVLLLAAFFVFSGNVFKDRTDREYRMTVSIPTEEARQMGQGGVTASKGSKVYLMDDGTQIGVLEDSFSSSSTTLVILLDAEALESGGFVPGDGIALTCEKLMTKNAKITGVEEVNDA